MTDRAKKSLSAAAVAEVLEGPTGDTKAQLEAKLRRITSDLPFDTVTIDVPDAKALRERWGLSQDAFADALGISAATLRNWEQRRRRPVGPAQVLLDLLIRRDDVAEEFFGEAK